MDKSEWEGAQGQTWAREWRRTDRSFSAVTERLLERTRGLKFRHALDIGCGAGELSLAIARGRPDAQITGVDVAPALVEVAKERGANLVNANFALGDAAQWQPEHGAAPELLISRHGVMFFADPHAAFGHLADIAADGAALLFSCFRSPAENPVFTDVAALLPEAPPPPPPGSPGPFGFADPARIRDILTSGGWTDIAIDAIDFAMVVGAGEDAVEDAVTYFSRIGPAAKAASLMDEGDRNAFLASVRKLARSNLHQSLVALPAAGWIVSATKG